VVVPLVFYVSGHGFGHAARIIEVVNALAARRPDLRIHVRTAAARWLFDLTVRAPITLEAVEVDVGVVQIDSLRPDVSATLARAAAFYRDLDARAEAEALTLRRLGARLVVADLPPLALAAAHRAGVPAVALGNFTWDWIYQDYVRLAGDAAWLPARIREIHALAEEAWRLPMHGGFAGFRRVRDLPLIARRSSRPPAEVRAALGLDTARPSVLVSFGGYGLSGLPLDEVAARGRFTVLTTAEPRPGQADGPHPLVRRTPGGAIVVDERELYARGFRYEDLVAAADIVVTKPGYGIVAECVANGTAMLYTDRGPFAEYPVLVEALHRWQRAAFIAQADLLAGRWDETLAALLASPAPDEKPRLDGAAVAAGWILSRLDAGS
jgi:L-arabinokinase